MYISSLHFKYSETRDVDIYQKPQRRLSVQTATNNLLVTSLFTISSTSMDGSHLSQLLNMSVDS